MTTSDRDWYESIEVVARTIAIALAAGERNSASLVLRALSELEQTYPDRSKTRSALQLVAREVSSQLGETRPLPLGESRGQQTLAR